MSGLTPMPLGGGSDGNIVEHTGSHWRNSAGEIVLTPGEVDGETARLQFQVAVAEERLREARELLAMWLNKHGQK